MFFRIISTVFFIGYFPIAPGTLASLVGFLLILFFRPSNLVILILLLITFILGVISAERVERQTNSKDPSFVVIDELAGYLTSVVFIPLTFQNLLIAFILFRFFDILKPPPIRLIEGKTKGGIGIMIDDIIAGIMSNISLRLLLTMF